MCIISELGRREDGRPQPQGNTSITECVPTPGVQDSSLDSVMEGIFHPELELGTAIPHPVASREDLERQDYYNRYDTKYAACPN